MKTSMDGDRRVVVSIEDAIERIGPHAQIHTFMQAGPMLVGADHQRRRLITAMRRYGVEESGPQACEMGHTLVIVAYPTPDGGTTPLWIEAKPAKAKP